MGGAIIVMKWPSRGNWTITGALASILPIAYTEQNH
jgi:hypothetical protein